MSRVVIIGAGLGGLAAAAALARAGMEVTVLEAHIYPDGCAGTFYHQGFRFDAGATLAAGFYPGGPFDLVAQQAGIESWPVRPAHQAMTVHLPDGAEIPLVAGEERWELRREVFGTRAEPFWRWQERTAEALWNLALCLPPWPPQTPSETLRLLLNSLDWMSGMKFDHRESKNPAKFTELLAGVLQPVAAHLGNAPQRLRLFVDVQLLISAQATSRRANALYGASALDLPRRGVVHLEGGMGTIAQTLVRSIRQNGGQVRYRQEAIRIIQEKGKPVAVETRQGDSFPAEIIVANLPPWNIRKLFDEEMPYRTRNLQARSMDGWGAFVLYLGIDGSVIPTGFTLHHQIVIREPLGEGNSIFLSLSPAWDASRAPNGRRAITISTHTKLAVWNDLYQNDLVRYGARKEAYTEQILAAAETILPGLWESKLLSLSGTPVTFENYTGRTRGWVGGFPQTSLLRTFGPRISPQLWMVGDCIFPGQSAAAVALGGLRIARTVLEEGLFEKGGNTDENRDSRERFGRLNSRLCTGDARRWP